MPLSFRAPSVLLTFRARFESRCLRSRSVSSYSAVAGQQPGAHEDWVGFPIKWFLIQLAGGAECAPHSHPILVLWVFRT